MSLRDLFESDVSAVFLNRDDLAETLTYRTVNGESRQVRYVETGRQQTTEDQGHHLLRVETVDLFVSDSITGGMSDPRLGDAIQFSDDRNGQWWDFVSRMECEGGFDVKWRKRLIEHSGQLRPSIL